MKQHLNRYYMSQEYLPPFAYGGHNAMIKHPWMEEMEATYGRMLDTGVIQVIRADKQRYGIEFH